MSEQKGTQNNSDTDGMIMMAVAVAAFCLFGWLIWSQFHIGISTVHVLFRNLLGWPIFQVYVFLAKMTGGDIPLLRMIMSNTTELCGPTQTLNIFTTCTRDFSTITFMQLSKGSMFFNVILGVISVGIAFVGFLRISSKHPGARFAKKHSLDSFMDEQKQNEPHLHVYSDFNLQMIDVNSGPLMGMKTTREYAKEFNLVTKESEREVNYISNGITKSQRDSKEKVPYINRKRLITLLRSHLGGLWVDVDSISDAEAILLAMYLPRACSTDPEMLDEEFKQIASNCAKLEREFWAIATEDILTGKQFAPTGVSRDKYAIYADGKKDLGAYKIETLKEKYIKPYINNKVTQKLLAKHAYTRTFIVAVVFEARRLGVMAPCQIRWLKFYDREIWAMLQNIGRPSFFCENMGVISHYQAEVVANTKIYQPHFDVAIRGFEFQLKTYLYSPEAMADIKGDSTKIKKSILDDY